MQHQQHQQQQQQHQVQQQQQQHQVQQQQQQHQVQQQQHMSAGMGGGIVRPPPPEYKAAQAQLMHAGIGMGQQSRFANAASMRRVTQQPMPPSGKCRPIQDLSSEIARDSGLTRGCVPGVPGPMMRPQMTQQTAMHATANPMYMGGGGVGTVGGVGVGLAPGPNAAAGGGMSAIGGMHQMQQRLGYPRTNNQRPPNINIGPPDTLGNGIASRGNTQNWQHIFMQQQQQQQHHQGAYLHLL
jgi:mastermind-like protein